MDTGIKYVGKQLLLLIIVLLLGILFLSLGLIIGYHFVGGQDSFLDVLTPDKWQEWIAKFTG